MDEFYLTDPEGDDLEEFLGDAFARLDDDIDGIPVFKAKNWVDYMICNCNPESASWHEYIETGDTYHYKCKICGWEKSDADFDKLVAAKQAAKADKPKKERILARVIDSIPRNAFKTKHLN